MRYFKKKNAKYAVICLFLISITKLLLHSNKEECLRASSKTDCKKMNAILNEVKYQTITKNILLWHVPFGDVTMPLEYIFDETNFSTNAEELKMKGFSFNTSLCSSCKVSFDRNSIQNSDAVVFHGLDVLLNDLPNPELRKSSQLYVYWNMETISHSDALRTNFMEYSLNDFYNITMTMRRISDIFEPYASLSWILKMLWYKARGIDLIARIARAKTSEITTESQLQTILNNLPTSSLTTKYEEMPPKIFIDTWKLLRKKSRMAIWIASNCGFPREFSVTRREYLEKLKQSGLKVDVFGMCGVPYPVGNRWDPAFIEIVSRYKFHFAMDNSYHCKDYIEKVWYNALYSGTVPVIFGPHKDDVAAVLPPKSYIFVEDLNDYHKLLKYLQYLDKNATAYAEYLEWRSWVKFLDKKGEFHSENFKNIDNLSEKKCRILKTFAPAKPIGYCALCRRLHEDKHLPQTVGNLNEWLQNERSECTNFTEGRDMFWSNQVKDSYNIDHSVRAV